ncbi:hypothetical protein HYH03_015991 [Edaphochlamys debaryana]|uniref:monoamine oxidase n=1 Tax=Edaphochlamys debaryana TaxID=47281 RepID=A0A835XM58_9CHLO|nr:hypothetical protein HYH03_015991 [Edaphochlamys debaryana]|eukprot:KAG2485318.1 hypothetical protein HYH03_015991 [Edaphochlamys debaryana]
MLSEPMLATASDEQPAVDAMVDLGGQWIGPTQYRSLQLVAELGVGLVSQPWFEDATATAVAAPTSVAATISSAAAPSSSTSLPAPSSPSGPAGRPSEAPSGPTVNLASGASAPLTEAEASELSSVLELWDQWAIGLGDPRSWSAHPHAFGWDRISVADWFRAHVALTAVRRELELLVLTVTASEPRRLSFLFWIHFLAMVGSTAAIADGPGGAQSFKVAGGMQQLSCRLYDDVVRRGGLVHVGAAVVTVDWMAPLPDGGTGVEVTLTVPQPPPPPPSPAPVPASPSSSPTPASVVGQAAAAAATAAAAAPPQRLRASFLVVAMSPPLWRDVLWRPPLPPAKRALGEGMYMGSAVKTIAVFDRAFWERRPDGSGQRPDGAGQQLDRAGQCPATAGPPPPPPRLEELGPVSNLFPGSVSGRPALVGLVVGDAAAELAAAPEAERRRRVLAQYQAFFLGGGGGGSAGGGAGGGGGSGGHCSRRAEGGEGGEVERWCVGWVSKDWMSEERSRGCYAALMPPGLATLACLSSAPASLGSTPASLSSALPAGGEAGAGEWLDGVTAARAPVGGRVFWAGTELAREWAGYFEGALEAGHRAAEEVEAAVRACERCPRPLQGVSRL